jgi:UDP-N-acetylmuramyl pentapeptide phosphotransferase/UDP-N-acetylglucosamine-1-phosphate transferase
LYFIFNDFSYPRFFIGLTTATALSFLDDVMTLSSKIRLPIQFISVALMLYQVLGNQWLLLALALIVATGILNAYNFMDGINGITGIYSLAVLLSLAYLNLEIEFMNPDFLYYSILGVVVFNFFNVRKKAKCFAGDVGSVSIAMIVMFALLKLIEETGNYTYILFLSVYGVDSILTIIHRLTKKENIFEAHRSHLYQWLVKPGPFSHIQMAILYGVIQFLINFTVIASINTSFTFQLILSLAIISALCILYIAIKKYYIKKHSLV